VIFPLLAILLASAGVDAAPTVLPNDNTHPAGHLEEGRLDVRLVAAAASRP